MVAKNDTDPEKRWVNGSIGVIQHLSKDEVKVLIKENFIALVKQSGRSLIIKLMEVLFSRKLLVHLFSSLSN